MAKEKRELVDKLSVNAADRSPLLRVQKQTYLETQAKAEKLQNISQYMFWGATSLMFGIITTIIGSIGSQAGIAGLMGTTLFGVGAPVLFGVAGVAAVGLAIGNMHFSSKAKAAMEKAEILYSDIDSQQQSHRMVQAFAKAQSQGQIHEANNPYAGTPGTSWAARVGSNSRSQSSWADRIAAEAHAEEAAVLNNAASR